jgi:uncharacterized protein (TIGR03435 family)
MRSVTITLGTLVLCGSALAQSEAPAPVFNVADVHVSPRGVRESGLYLHGNRFELHGATMLRLIETAYEVQEDRIFGGPNWLDTNRYEIVAKAETPVNMKTFRPMLQTLLADRFQLKVRKEDKPEPIYALVPGRKILLKPNAAEGEPDCNRTNENGYLTLTCHNVTMEYLAARLPGAAPNYFNHPVEDKTGLKGSYDVTVKWTGRGQIGAGDADHPSISLFNYFEKELGIKVEEQTRQAGSVTIESVSETPSPNPPGTAENLPPPVTEFEVVEIRPSKPDTQQNFSMRSGRIEAFALTLKDLIGFAFSLDDYMLDDADKWLSTDHFDLIAKADPSVTDGTLQAMLRTLIVERFHFKSHFEDRPVNVWALTAPKGLGKLKESTGAEHAGCKRTPADGAFTYSCRNTTMAQFAAKLPDVGGAAGYINDHPMVDLTGLKGSYDFDITWSPPARVYGQGGRGKNNETASTPNGGLTIFEAIGRQLGLKLAVEKHPMPVFVIDHIDRTPSEN